MISKRSGANRTRAARCASNEASHSSRARLMIPTILAVATLASCTEAAWGEDAGDGCVLVHGHDDVVMFRICQVGPSCRRTDSADGQVGRITCTDEAGCTVTTEPDADPVTICPAPAPTG